jgi:hypothetical protein
MSIPCTGTPRCASGTAIRPVPIPSSSARPLPAEEEGDPPPDVHRVLVPLDRREDVAFELAGLGCDRLTRAALAVGLDLRARRGLEVLPELVGLGRRQGEVDDAVGDLPHLLGRHVSWLPERRRGDREPVEDVLGVVAGDLVDLADLAPVRGEDLPAGPHQQPGDRVGHC